jgi:hypothetical protein
VTSLINLAYSLRQIRSSLSYEIPIPPPKSRFLMPKPSCFNSKHNSLIFRKAILKGSREVICDPMWVAIPKILIFGKVLAL